MAFRALRSADCLFFCQNVSSTINAEEREAAQHRNIEVGLLLRSSALSHQAAEFFHAMVREGVCVRA